MKNVVKKCYVMQNKKGDFFLSSISYNRKTCIENFTGDNFTWKDAVKCGWKCIKVQLTLENLYK